MQDSARTVADRDNRPAILVVDDEYLIRMSTAQALREQGFDVIEAGNADEAITVLRALHIDAVFSDITMPGALDGIGLATWIRRHKPAVKTVLTSGTAPFAGESDGLGPVLPKPYRVGEVADALRAAIGQPATPDR